MSKYTIGILGGSGFIGSFLANELVERGHAIRILTRDREHARHLWLLPDTEVIALDPYDQDQLNHAAAGLDGMVNLVGILNERGDSGAGFRHAHVDLAVRVLKACKAAEVRRLVHMSALNADSFAPSHYLRSKGEAEKLVLAEHSRRLAVTVLRPSVMFGPHDSFLNRFARLLALCPGVFPLACAQARFQPIYVGDVAAVCLHALAAHAPDAARYDLGGPAILSLREIVEYVARVIGRPVRIVELGPRLSALQANLLEFVPGKPFSRDNLRSLQEDSVCARGNGLEQLGIAPTPLEAIVPQYLGGRQQRRRLYGFRVRARR